MNASIPAKKCDLVGRDWPVHRELHDGIELIESDGGIEGEAVAGCGRFDFDLSGGIREHAAGGDLALQAV